MSAPQIVAAMPGDPRDPLTWSGASRHMLEALDRRGALAGAVNGRPAPIDLVEKAAAIDRDRVRWRQRYASRSTPVSALARRARGRYAAWQIGRLGVSLDAVMQVGGWCDPEAYATADGALRASYHDGNLAVYLRRPELRIDPAARAVRRGLAAERRLYDALDLILPMSDWLRASFIEDFGQDPAKVVTVGGGANIDALPDVPERDFERPRLLFVGKGDFGGKGGPDVLEAFRAVRSAHPDAELWVVGQPPRPDAPPGVRFMGRILRNTPEGEAEIDRVYREATLFVMPSRYEAFGIVFLEAMAYGLPCVAAATCAMPEIVADAETGRVVPHGDPDRLAEALLEIAGDPERAHTMGAAGRRRLEERFTWDAVAGRIVDAVRGR